MHDEIYVSFTFDDYRSNFVEIAITMMSQKLNWLHKVNIMIYYATCKFFSSNKNSEFTKVI